MKTPRLYSEFADWWPLLSSPEDYEEEAAIYYRLMTEACAQSPRSLLELGSGGGNNAYHLSALFDQVTLVDLSDGMLNVSRKLNPACEHIVGDMRNIRLGRDFDCVFIHDAVVYMISEDELRQTMQTAFVHCREGGVALFCPDHLKEN